MPDGTHAWRVCATTGRSLSAEVGALNVRLTTQPNHCAQWHQTAHFDPELSFLAVPPTAPLRRTADYQVPCDPSGSGAALAYSILRRTAVSSEK